VTTQLQLLLLLVVVAVIIIIIIIIFKYAIYLYICWHINKYHSINTHGININIKIILIPFLEHYTILTLINTTLNF